MNTAATSSMRGDCAAILDRHARRRAAGIPTVSLLVGPLEAGGGTWRRWANDSGQRVVLANRNLFPHAEWVRSAVEQSDLRTVAVRCIAQRVGRDPNEFLAEWRDKTPADRDRFWNTLAPDEEDDLLRAVATACVDRGSFGFVAPAVNDLGERIVPAIVRLFPSALWPGILFAAGSADDLLCVGDVAAGWALRVPALSIAVTARAGVWDEYVAMAPESRAKALVREGELRVPLIDAATVVQALTEAGAAESAVAAIAAAAATGADSTLLEEAVAAVRATADPPTTRDEDDRARSAAERFLFAFLESLPETAGRFELNGPLDFAFGPRPVEVDLLCRSPKVAIELDGYFHFLEPDDFRRDRTKDYELQRRGFVVLRFLAEDVIPRLEMIRDRILDALTISPLGGHL
jgi:Protein of unknown function (DUF559)